MAIESVVVIGAGVAGLAAARRLRTAGIATTLIEAGTRIGGRAHTTLLGGDVFDHGASWLHDATHNPLMAFATPADRMVDSDQDRVERVSISGRPATPTELATFDAAWARVEQAATAPLQQPDTTLQAGLAAMQDDPWQALVLLWEGAIIAAADANRLSLHDWHRNRLGGYNAVPPAGVGAFVCEKLATPAVLRTKATRITWNGRGVQVETPGGTISADAAVITVSTGVLASGSIAFDPALPPPVQEAIAGLPMGLLSKVVLPATGPGRLGLAADTLVMDQASRMTFNAWPLNRAHLVGFLGGDLAWQVGADLGAANDLARTELCRAMGQDATNGVGPAALVTAWSEDPLFLGAYAYARPGDAERRGQLAEAFPGERLLFAGEAVRVDGLAGTVGGAFLSGVAAAERLLGLSATPAAGPAGSL